MLGSVGKRCDIPDRTSDLEYHTCPLPRIPETNFLATLAIGLHALVELAPLGVHHDHGMYAWTAVARTQRHPYLRLLT